MPVDTTFLDFSTAFNIVFHSILLNDGKLAISQQTAKRVSCALGCIRHSIASHPKVNVVSLCSAPVRPHLKYCVEFWASQYKKDVKLLAEHWNSLPREVAITSSLLEFKKQLDGGLRNTVWTLGSSVWSQKIDLMILVGHFQLRIVYESMISTCLAIIASV